MSKSYISCCGRECLGSFSVVWHEGFVKSHMPAGSVFLVNGFGHSPFAFRLTIKYYKDNGNDLDYLVS